MDKRTAKVRPWTGIILSPELPWPSTDAHPGSLRSGYEWSGLFEKRQVTVAVNDASVKRCMLTRCDEVMKSVAIETSAFCRRAVRRKWLLNLGSLVPLALLTRDAVVLVAAPIVLGGSLELVAPAFWAHEVRERVARRHVNGEFEEALL